MIGYESPKFLRKSEEKLKRKQRAVSKKKRGSNRRRKAVRELARLHEKVANQRKDYAHKESRKLVNEYGLIAFEDLNIQGMVKNHHLAKSIADSGWNQLVQFVTYKAESAGRQVVQVNPITHHNDALTVAKSSKNHLLFVSINVLADTRQIGTKMQPLTY